MRPLREFKFNKIIDKDFEFSFKIDKDGLYLLEISARCKNWRQNWGKLFDDDDLTVSLDGRDLSGVTGRRAFEKPKAGWNGNQLKNLSQINVFILRLKAGAHRLVFKPDQSPKVEFLRIYQITNPAKVEFDPRSPNNQAEDGDRRPWYTFSLIDLALENLTIAAKAYSGRQHTLFQSDDDDLQVKINSERQRNDTPKSHPYWFWCGKILKGESRTFEKELNLSSGTHYIELFADRTPTLEKVTFKFTGVLPVGKIKLYKDVTTLNRVHLWKEPSAESGIIAELSDGDEVEVLEERVVGSYVDAESYIWHKVNYKGQTGFVLSTFVELPGQDRDTVTQKIKYKARELGVDENIVLALSGCESQYKPFATSGPYDPENPLVAKGVFQLTKGAKDQVEKEGFKVEDDFNIDQSIEGGIRYFLWLLKTYYDGVSQSIEKTVAAYNWGQDNVPADEPLSLEDLPKQTANLVTCVLENKKRRNWRQIFLPLLIFLFGFAAGNGYSYLNRIDFFESTVPEVLSEQSTPVVEDVVEDVQKRNCPDVFRGNNDRELTLVDDLCHTVRIFSDQELELELSDRWDSLRGSHQVIQTGNLFYFLATSFLRCGAQNCTYVLYKYNVEGDTLDIITDGVFGISVKLHLSPDEKRIAIVRRAHAFSCDERSYLDLVDIASKEKQHIDKFQDSELEVTHIDELKWLSDQKLEILTTHGGGCDPSEHTIRRKRFLYDLETGKIEPELLEEREVIP